MLHMQQGSLKGLTNEDIKGSRIHPNYVAVGRVQQFVNVAQDV